MEKNNCIVLWLMAVVLLGAPLFGQTGEAVIARRFAPKQSSGEEAGESALRVTDK